LLKLNIEEGKISFPVIELMHKHFRLKTPYTFKDIKIKVQQMFDEFNIQCIATAKDVERYFDFKSTKDGSDNRVYIFIGYKQLSEIQQKHI